MRVLILWVVLSMPSALAVPIMRAVIGRVIDCGIELCVFRRMMVLVLVAVFVMVLGLVSEFLWTLMLRLARPLCKLAEKLLRMMMLLLCLIKCWIRPVLTNLVFLAIRMCTGIFTAMIVCIFQ